MIPFIIGLIVGANVSFILYAIILAGRSADEQNDFYKSHFLDVF